MVMSRIAAARILAALLAIALCGFQFLRHHITQAPVIDTTSPFFGTGLVIGPAEQLPGLAKRVPMKLKLYKWLKRKGNTQYVPGVMRQADCSLSEAYVDLAEYTLVRTLPHFERRLHDAAGLQGAFATYPDGCADPLLGTSARNGAGGRLPDGQFVGAGPDFHADTSIVVYRSDGQTLLDQHDIELAPQGATQFVGNFAVADLDHDGNPDYAVSVGAYGDDAVARIAILLGDGAGGYAAPVSYTIAAAPAGSGKSAFVSGFTIADLDGDTKLDIAASYSIGGGDGAIVLLHGNGDGSFGAAAQITSEAGYALLTADFNGDGKPDLASGDGHILFGDGAGGFDLAPGPRFDAGLFASGDFNDDGKIDLVVYSQFGDGSPLHIWLGDGTGQFTRIEAGYATGYGSGSSDLDVTDLDGDGHTDIVFGSSGDGIYGPGINSQGQTQFLLGRGDGTFASPPFWTNTVAVTGDFDRDGKADLLSLDTSTQNHGVRPMLGDGQGGFHAGVFSSLGFNFYSQTLEAWLAVDLDGDGKTDLVATQTDISGPPSGTLHTRLGNGDGTFHATGADIALSMGLGTFTYADGSLPAAADFDADGKLDLALIGYSATASGLYLMRGNGDGSLQSPQTIDGALNGDGNPPDVVVAADFNGDGKPDLAVIDAGRRYANPAVAGSARVYRNLGGSFAAPLVLPGVVYPEALTVADVNGDGRADVVIASEPSGYANDTLFVFLGNGDGTFQAARTQELPDFWFQSIKVADADSDGKPDLVIGNCCGLTFASFARGDGTGAFSTPSILPLTVSPAGLALADLTGDGHPDLLVQAGYSTTPNVRTFLNTWRDAIFASGFDPP
jgi:hypothetical protein